MGSWHNGPKGTGIKDLNSGGLDQIKCPTLMK